MSVLKKLDEFKKIVGKVKKDGTNPFHKSKYATLDSVLETIEEPLRQVGLGYYQTTEKDGLVTTIYDLEDTKLFISGFLPFIGATDMQKLGSAITYNRRYGLVTLCGLEQEDDDGNYASGYNKKPVQQKTPPVQNHTAESITTLANTKGFPLQKITDAYKKPLDKFTQVELNAAYNGLLKK